LHTLHGYIRILRKLLLFLSLSSYERLTIFSVLLLA
jgi:hypothetical protein